MKNKIIFIMVYFLFFVFILYSQTNENIFFSKHTDYNFELLETDSLDPQNVRDIVLVDINNDSYKDIICITVQAGDIRTQEYSLLIIFKNEGDGTFSQDGIIKCNSIYKDMDYGKINEDEYIDLVLYGDSLCILINDGIGNFEFSCLPQDLTGLSLSVNKLNSDEFDDIAVTGWSKDIDFVILLNNGNGIFDSLKNYDINLDEYSCTDIACVDLNNDDIKDVSVFMWLNDIACTIYNYLNNGNGNLTFVSKYEFNFESGDFIWTDLNNDGNLDVIVPRGYPRRLIVVFGNGNGTLSTELVYRTEFMVFTASDINNDGHEDIILTSSDSLKILLNDFKDKNNFKVGEKHAIFIPPIWGSAAKIACGDIDNDGDNDIVISNYNPYHGGVTVFENSSITTDIKSEIETPTGYHLYDNYPNPFNPVTTISYQLPKKGQVTLKIYNSLGKEIRELVNSYQGEGSYSVQFDGSDLPSGVYFYKLTASTYTDTKKLILMK